MSRSKKLIFFLILLLSLLYVGIWHYRRPYFKKFGLSNLVIVYQAQYRPDVVTSEGKPVEFVIISVIKGELIVELITGPGVNNVRRLTGDEAEQFLAHHRMTIYGG